MCAHVRRDDVEGHVEEIVAFRVAAWRAPERDEMVLLEDNGEGRLRLAVLVGEDHLGHERELVRDGVHVPVHHVDRHGVLVDLLVPTVAEVERRHGSESERVADALHEGDQALVLEQRGGLPRHRAGELECGLPGEEW